AMKRFHSPCSRAVFCRSRITCGCSCGLSLAAICRSYTASAGYTCSVLNASSFSAGSAVGGEYAQSMIVSRSWGVASGQPVNAGDDEAVDRVGELFLGRVVVAALAVSAQVVAHDRGHLEPSECIEPGEVGERPGLGAVDLDEVDRGGQALDDAADTGEIGAVGKDEE